jgi:hypothetical protein
VPLEVRASTLQKRGSKAKGGSFGEVCVLMKHSFQPTKIIMHPPTIQPEIVNSSKNTIDPPKLQITFVEPPN